MGKMSMEFMVAAFPDGIDFKLIQEVLNSLEGECYINGFTRNIYPDGSETYLIHFTNSHFLDGTTVMAKYRSLYNSMGQTVIFDGVIITEPPNAQISVGPLLGYSGAPGTNGQPPSSVQNSQPPTPVALGSLPSILQQQRQPNPSKPPAAHPYANIDNDINSVSACTCGAGSVGGGHSRWCDTNVPF